MACHCKLQTRNRARAPTDEASRPDSVRRESGPRPLYPNAFNSWVSAATKACPVVPRIRRIASAIPATDEAILDGCGAGLVDKQTLECHSDLLQCAGYATQLLLEDKQKR